MAFTDQSIGIHLIGPARFRVYENDIYRRTFTYQREHTGSRVAMSARQATGRVDRFEAWTEPKGSLVFADEHTSLAGWTLGHNGANWTSSGGEAQIAVSSGDDLSSVLVRDKQGANYFVLRNIDFDNTDTIDRWFMLTVNKAGTGRTDDPDVNGPGDDGYRLLIRQSLASGGQGVPEATNLLQVVNQVSSEVEPLIPIAWQIGSIRMGAFT